jgi:hypothetical protein
MFQFFDDDGKGEGEIKKNKNVICHIHPKNTTLLNRSKSCSI